MKPVRALREGSVLTTRGTEGAGPCAGAAVISFQDRGGRRQSGCTLALKQLIETGEIEPLGHGA